MLETLWTTDLLEKLLHQLEKSAASDLSLHCSELLFSLILGTVALFQKIGGIALEGFTTVIIIQLFTGSIIMMSLGIIGYYIARI